MGEDPRKLESAAGKKRRRGTLRLLGRIVALALAVVLLLDVLPWDAAPMVVPAVSPWVAICSAVALRSFSWIVLLAVPVLVLSVLRKRWFCRYACPVGLLTEQAGRPMVWTRGVAGRLPHLGRWFALIGLAGRVGYRCSGTIHLPFSADSSASGQPLSLATLLPAIGLLIVLGLSGCPGCGVCGFVLGGHARVGGCPGGGGLAPRCVFR